MTELRVYLPIYDLQPQFAAYLSTPTRARGYPPFEGQHSLIIEVAPALAIHRISDLALKAAPDMEPGILFTERQFGLLELHSSDREELDAAGDAILICVAWISVCHHGLFSNRFQQSQSDQLRGETHRKVLRCRAVESVSWFTQGVRCTIAVHAGHRDVVSDLHHGFRLPISGRGLQGTAQYRMWCADGIGSHLDDTLLHQFVDLRG